jgi:hypothetical protein
MFRLADSSGLQCTIAGSGVVQQYWLRRQSAAMNLKQICLLELLNT